LLTSQLGFLQCIFERTAIMCNHAAKLEGGCAKIWVIWVSWKNLYNGFNGVVKRHDPFQNVFKTG
jgi:hypothetical protein